MPPELIVAIVFIAVGIPVLSGTLIKLAKIVKGEPNSSNISFDKKSKNPTSDRHEAEIVQEINQLVTRLEKRIESLETIVLDQTKR